MNFKQGETYRIVDVQGVIFKDGDRYIVTHSPDRRTFMLYDKLEQLEYDFKRLEDNKCLCTLIIPKEAKP